MKTKTNKEEYIYREGTDVPNNILKKAHKIIRKEQLNSEAIVPIGYIRYGHTKCYQIKIFLKNMDILILLIYNTIIKNKETNSKYYNINVIE